MSISTAIVRVWHDRRGIFAVCVGHAAGRKVAGELIGQRSSE